MTPDEVLLDQIRIKYGRFIDRAVAGTLFPAGLLAALVANEAGLDENAQRFEPGDFWQLAFVAIGKKAAHDRPSFGAIGRQDLTGYLTLAGVGAIAQLVDLASSHGPLQIMGYEALAGKFPISELADPATCFRHGVQMLEAFKVRFNLRPYTVVTGPPSVANEPSYFAGAFFTCWNTGRPDGQTYDPQYAEKGLARLAIYESGAPGPRLVTA
jgi:hypothetical protein